MDRRVPSRPLGLGAHLSFFNLSLAPGFSPVGAGDAAPSRFNGFGVAGAENG
jgi:hypothetical protein